MGPSYQLEALEAVARDLDKLGHVVQQRIAARIDAFADAPRPSGAHAIAGHPGSLGIRVGDYRVVYHVNDTARIVTIVIVGHRDDVYDWMARQPLQSAHGGDRDAAARPAHAADRP